MFKYPPLCRGWLGGAKVLCILHHWGVQLILAYSWARPAILVAGKGRGGMFLFLLFLHFHSCSSFFPVPLCHLLYYLFSLSLGDDTKWPSRVDVSLNPNTTINPPLCFHGEINYLDSPPTLSVDSSHSRGGVWVALWLMLLTSNHEVQDQLLLLAEYSSWLWGISLHSTFHYHLSIVLI